MNRSFHLKIKSLLLYLMLFCSAFLSGNGKASYSYSDERFNEYLKKNNVPWLGNNQTRDDLKSKIPPAQIQKLKEAYEAKKEESLEALKRDLKNPQSAQNRRNELLEKFFRAGHLSNYIDSADEDIKRKADIVPNTQRYLSLLLVYHSLNDMGHCKYYINKVAPPQANPSLQAKTFMRLVQDEQNETKLKLASVLFMCSHPTEAEAQTWHQAGETLLKTVSGQAAHGSLNWATGKAQIKRYADFLKDSSTYIGLAHYALKHNDGEFCVASLLEALKNDSKTIHHISDFLELLDGDKKILKELMKQCLLHNRLSLDPSAGKLLPILEKADPITFSEAQLELETGLWAFCKRNPVTTFGSGLGVGLAVMYYVITVGIKPR